MLYQFFKEYKEYKIIHSHIKALSLFVLRAVDKADVLVRIAHSHNSSASTNYFSLSSIVKELTKKYIDRYTTNNIACSVEAGK